jgi:density-regulated protein DRP1
LQKLHFPIGSLTLIVEYCQFSPVCEKLDKINNESKIENENESKNETETETKTVKQKQEEKKPNNSKNIKKVIIRVVDRTKRKRVTEISGLDTFQIDLKKASKIFSSKFACGSSITKLATGIEEIHITGDFGDDVKILIQDLFAISPNDITIADPKKK